VNPRAAPVEDGSTARDQTIGETPRTLGLRAQRILSALEPSWTRAARREALDRRRLVKGTYGPGTYGPGYLGLHDIDALAWPPRMSRSTPSPAASNASVTAAPWTRSAPTPPEPAADGERPHETAGEAADPASAGTKEDQPRPDESASEADDTGSAEPASNIEPADDAAGANGDPDYGHPEHDDADARADQVRVPPPLPVPRARADVDLIVHINTLADLVDALRRGEPADVAGLGPIPTDLAARPVKAAAARPSTWCTTLIDDTGRVVEHGCTHHDPTTAMRDYVNARDRHCRFPGCTLTATRCDTDHTTPWETGGATCPSNLTPAADATTG